MKGYNNINGIRLFSYIGILLMLLLVVLLLTGCRRDLWVYQDNFKQVELDVDWRNYFRDQQLYSDEYDPDGMTVWFFPTDGRESYRYTTANVRHFETYLSKGTYEGLVVDYSPEEYGRQEFLGMDFAETARVQALPNSYQPDSIPQLYGPQCYAHALPMQQNGYCELAFEPENIACDTAHMEVYTGEYDRYIPYEERDSYQSSLVRQLYLMEPLIIPWNMRVRIYIKGIYYLYNTEASLAGMADGYYFMQGKTSNSPCLLKLDDWEVHITGDNVGYIAKTFKTWGPLDFSNLYDIRSKHGPDELSTRPADQVRLNFKFLLRDRQTVCYYSFDVGNLVRCYYNEYALRIDLMDGFDGQPDLPYVDAYNGMGFDGIVVPWENTDSVDVVF